jgi:hypothetical protein
MLVEADWQASGVRQPNFSGKNLRMVALYRNKVRLAALLTVAFVDCCCLWRRNGT